MTPSWIKHWSHRSAVAILATNGIFLLVCIFSRWPEWWANVIYGKSALNWFTSVQLSWIAIACLAIAVLLGLIDRPKEISANVFWLTVAAGFFYLSVEEHFRIHVRLREGLLKPHGIASHIPGIGSGDVVPLCYAVVGLAFVYPIYKYLERDPKARRWFVWAIITGLIGVGMDARDFTGWSMTFYHKHKFINEVFTRTLSPMSFLMAFNSYFWTLLGRITNAEA